MAHAFGDKQRIPVTANTTSTANPLAANVTLGAGTTVMVVALIYAGSTVRGGGTPTYNGIALTQADTFHKGTTSPECSCEIWYMLNPPTGSAYSLSIPNSGGLAMEANVSWYSAASGKTSALDAVHGLNGATSTNPTDSITTIAANCLIVSAVTDGAQTWAPTPQSGTVVYNDDDGNWGGGSQYTLDAGAAGAKSYYWTFGTSEDWGVVAVSIKEVNIYSDSDTEAASATDVPSATQIKPSEIAEAATAIEAPSAMQIMPSAIAEAASAAEASDRLLITASAIIEAASATEISDATLPPLTAGITEAASAISAQDVILAVAAGITEAASATDSLDAIQVQVATITEACSAAEIPDGLRITDTTITEIASAADVQSGLSVTLAGIAEIVSAAETVNGLRITLAGIIEAGNGVDISVGQLVGGPLEASITEIANAADISNGLRITAADAIAIGTALDDLAGLRITYAGITEIFSPGDTTAALGILVAEQIEEATAIAVQSASRLGVGVHMQATGAGFGEGIARGVA
jgi:hypothetical protein